MIVDVPGSGSVTVRGSDAGSASWRFVYAPGAGSNIDDPFGAYCSQTLPVRGVDVVRFQFPYMEAKKRSPDRPAVLEATWRAVIEQVRTTDVRLVVGGRSMGGRIASQVLAQGVSADALALFAYPLHPPGKPQQRRDEHLRGIAVSTLFCSGTNDSFAAPTELADAAATMPQARVHILDGADHGFSVRKDSGRTREDVWAEAVQAMCEWLDV